MNSNIYTQELYTSYLWDRSGQLHSGFSPFGVVASQDTPQDCCRLRRDVDVSWSEAWGTYVSTSQSCDLIPTNAAVDEPLFSPGRNLTHVFARNLERNPLVKWQYFISMQGLHVEYPAHNFNDDSHPLLHPQHHHRRNYAASTSMAGGNGGGAASEAGPDACDDAIHARHRDVFVSTVMPRRKNVVIVIDQGRSLSDYQMAIAKAVAKHVLESLSEEDYVGVLALSDKVSLCVMRFNHSDFCESSSFPPLSVVLFLTQFIFFLPSFLGSGHRGDTGVNFQTSVHPYVHPSNRPSPPLPVKASEPHVPIE